jgi:hypothetical protein
LHSTVKTACRIGLAFALLSCKNPVDAALDEALDFTGVFESDNGFVIEVEGDDAIIRALGSSEWGTRGVLKIGDRFLRSVAVADDGSVTAYVVKPRVFGTGSDGTVTYVGWIEPVRGTLVDGRLTLDDGADGLRSFRHTADRWSGPSSPSGPGTPTSPPTTGGTVVLSQTLEGQENSKTFFKVTLPSGITRMQVELTENTGGRQLADMFVRRGSQPTVALTPSYNWTADCAGIESNRADERCTFNNPASGDWHILVYGYHAYYGAQLKVTTWR